MYTLIEIGTNDVVSRFVRICRPAGQLAFVADLDGIVEVGERMGRRVTWLTLEGGEVDGICVEAWGRSRFQATELEACFS